MDHIRVQDSTVPALGFGTFRMKGDECTEAVRTAIAAGYRHLDTAEIYENEEAVARGLRDAGVPREEIFLTTKAWMEDLSPAGVQRSLEASLRRLDTDYVDLWLIHWPNPVFPLRDTLAAMSELVVKGRVRHLGVSNFPAAQFDEAAAMARIVCNQVEYHPYLSQRPVLAAARSRGAFVTAYAPVAMGRVRDDAVLQRIGERYGKSAAQVTLRWLVQQSNVAAIPKASNPEHVRENAGIFDFALTDDEMSTIHALARGERLIDPEFAPDWDPA